MEAAPVCGRCHKVLDNWVGNIMVDNSLYPERISQLQVICKGCTRQLDASGFRKQYHNIWELSWIREAPLLRLAEILQEITQQPEAVSRWEADAIKEVGFLVALTLPYEEARLFLRYLIPNEWDYDGAYLNRLKERFGMHAE